MILIHSIKGFEILDSRGNPTVMAEVCLTNGIKTYGVAPSGASTGTHEAVEKRDKDPERYQGKGVREAVHSISHEIHHLLQGKSPLNQAEIDANLISLDGTVNKSRLGANAILSVSLAIAKAGAMVTGQELYQYIGGCQKPLLPCPMLNIINGGAHADNSIDFQEFMIRPHAATSFSEAIRWGVEIYHSLKAILKKKGAVTGVGDEGGFAPNLKSDEETLDIIMEAITHAGYSPGNEISIALDCAATELFDEATHTYIEKKKKKQNISSWKKRSSEEQVSYLEELVRQYPIDSIEDGLAENDWAGWTHLTQKLGHKVQIVGDDIFVTNPMFLEKGIQEKAANAILIKPNQIGTLTETIEAIQTARRAGFRTIISHRSGETEDGFISDLCVGTGAGQIKAGAPCRSERLTKYNRLILIEALAPQSIYLDTNQESLFNSSKK